MLLAIGLCQGTPLNGSVCGIEPTEAAQGMVLAGGLCQGNHSLDGSVCGIGPTEPVQGMVLAGGVCQGGTP